MSISEPSARVPDWVIRCAGWPVKVVIVPTVTYLIVFATLTYPLLFSFSTHLFADDGDGLQNVWNIWWVNRSVTYLNRLPWYTYYLHYPEGVSLVAHTLNPFNGFLGILLLRVFTLPQTYDFLLVMSFVIGGTTAFILCYDVTRSYWASIVGGGIFTFSNFHFAHAQGHLQLVSLEWIPLFIFLWYRFVQTPSIRLAVAANVALVLVILCDYYYFFYCVIAAILILIWWIRRKETIRWLVSRPFAGSLATFLVIAVATCGPLLLSLVLLNQRDPLNGAHSAADFSLDLGALIIPGGHWRFASLTELYWGSLPGNIHESSVDLGLSVVALIGYVWLKRRTIKSPNLDGWFAIIAVFGILSLGPYPHVGGRQIDVPMPYMVLERILPPLKLSGTPIRMIVMVFLGASVVSAAGLKQLASGGRLSRIACVGILSVLTFEYLPGPIPSSIIPVPAYVKTLAQASDGGAVLDLASTKTLALYYQTIYQKPMAFGYVSRLPASVAKTDSTVLRLADDRNFDILCHQFHFQHIVLPADAGLLDLGDCSK